MIHSSTQLRRRRKKGRKRYIPITVKEALTATGNSTLQFRLNQWPPQPVAEQGIVPFVLSEERGQWYETVRKSLNRSIFI